VEARGSTQEGAPLELAFPPLPDSGHHRESARACVLDEHMRGDNMGPSLWWL
jgi:hypothetical protein